MTGSTTDYERVMGDAYIKTITTTSITNSGTLTQTGAQTIGGNLTVTGNLAVTGTQAHTGALTQTGAATFGTTVGVTGLTTLTGGATSVGQVTVTTLPVRCTANVGTAGTNCTAVEFGDGTNHITQLTLTAVALTAIAGADLGIGALIYTFPAGVVVVKAVQMNMTAGTFAGDTGIAADVGVGSVIATNAVTVLGGTAGFEDYVTGQTVADVASFVSRKTTIPTAAVSKVIESGDAHTVHLNVAAAWAATGTPTVTGTVIIHWEFSSA